MVTETGQAHRHDQRWHLLILLVQQDTSKVRLLLVDGPNLFKDFKTREQIAEHHDISALRVAFSQKDVGALNRLALFNRFLKDFHGVDPGGLKELSLNIQIAVLSDLNIIGEYLLNQRVHMLGLILIFLIRWLKIILWHLLNLLPVIV